MEFRQFGQQTQQKEDYFIRETVCDENLLLVYYYLREQSANMYAPERSACLKQRQASHFGC
jgi:hypothetical protein